jgi:hypothetical protein
LNKGLGFCPTPMNITRVDFHTDVLRLIRSLRLKHHHHTQESTDSINPTSSPDDNATTKFRPPSQWTPGPNINYNLDLFCNIIESELLTQFDNKKRISSNLSVIEQQALKELAQNTNIIIKPADKGGAVVILNKIDYINEANNQLKDKRTYTRLTKDITLDKQKEINEYLKECLERKWISENEYKYLCTYQPRTALFYLLPKIHKPQRPPPGRPIVSACGSITEKISEFVDAIIRPYVQIQASYIKDTQDFLQKISGTQTRPSTILATIDVSSLYTNIPHVDGIKAIRDILEENQHQSPPIECIEKLTQLVLTNNIFKFKDTLYIQTQGTAMGTRMAPSYANLFMAKLEQNFLANQPFLPESWYRFIDDIFMIWDHPAEELETFMKDLNKFHNTIKFTMELSTTEVSFLDTIIYKDSNYKLCSKLYTKPTDAHLYLRFDSCHPRNCIKSIPYSQFMRMHRIHTYKEEADKSMTNLQENFVKRGYPKNLLQRCRERVQTPKQNTENKDNTIMFITQFHPGLGNLKEIWDRNIKILLQHPDTTFLANTRFMQAYRRPTNIKDILVKTDLTRHKRTPGCHPCCKPRCLTCRLIKKGTTFVSNIKQNEYKIKGSFNCQSNYVIYLISCSKCEKQYVGQTSTTLNSRMIAHRYDIKHQLDKPVAKHFTSVHTPNDLTVQVIDVAPRDVTSRHLRETSWIRQLVTLEPHGLNIAQTTA